MPKSVKSKKQIAELHRALEMKMSAVMRCGCESCMLAHMLYDAMNDALLWTQGMESEKTSQIVDLVLNRYAKQTRHQRALSA